MGDLRANVQEALSAVEDQPTEVKAAVVAATATASIPPPEGPVVGTLWQVLVWGLVLVLLGALAGIIWIVVDGDTETAPNVVVTVFSSALTGLIGLFVTPSANR